MIMRGLLQSFTHMRHALRIRSAQDWCVLGCICSWPSMQIGAIWMAEPWLAIFMLIVVCVTLTFCMIMLMHDHRWFVRGWAWIMRRQAIELRCYDGRKFYTIVSRLPHERTHKRQAPVRWFTAIGAVVINDDGTIDAHESESSYVTSWLPLNKHERVSHILTYGVPS